MAQRPPTAAGGDEFLPVLSSKTEEKQEQKQLDGHDPRGSGEETQAILSGLPSASLAQSIDLPLPRLAHDFRLSARLERKVSLGQSCWGERNWVGVCGGDWSATWGRGKIVPGGQDAQLLTGDKSTFVDTRYLLVTDDAEPAHIMVRTEGWRTGPADVLSRLLDPVEGDKVDPSEYRFRLFVRLETGDERYRWVNSGMWIGSGIRRGAAVIYDGYRLL